MKINGNDYRIPEIDYNAVCTLDQYQIDLLDIQGSIQPFVMLRGFLALAMGTSRNNAAAASKELEAHILKNGLDDGEIARAFAEIKQALEDSDFLSQIREQRKKQKASSATAKTTRKAPKKSSEAPTGDKMEKESEPTTNE